MNPAGDPGGGPRAPIEAPLLGLFLAAWLLAWASLLGLVDLTGIVPLGFHGLFATAAAAGWVAGNVYLHRCRDRPRPIRRRLLVIYFLGPPGFVYLLRAMGPAPLQAAPLAPILGFGVFSIFFLVPVTLRGVGRGKG